VANENEDDLTTCNGLNGNGVEGPDEDVEGGARQVGWVG